MRVIVCMCRYCAMDLILNEEDKTITTDEKMNLRPLSIHLQSRMRTSRVKNYRGKYREP